MSATDPNSAVPNSSARVVGIRPNLPEDFFSGDPIELHVAMDRSLTALECRVLDEQGPQGWEVFSGMDFMTVKLSRVNEDTLGQIQAVLDETNMKAAERARQAEGTRSLLARLIDTWGM